MPAALKTAVLKAARCSFCKDLFSTLKKPRHYLWVTAAVTLFFALIVNLPFWRHALDILQTSEGMTLAFKIAAPLAIVLLLYAVFILCCSYRFILKPVCTLLFLSCAPAFYAAWNYHIIFDGNVIASVVETNTAEALSYFSWPVLAVFFLLGVLPSLLLWRVKIYYPRPAVSLTQRLLMLLTVLTAASLCIFPLYHQYSAFKHNNKVLNKELLPVSYVYAAADYAYNRFAADEVPYVVLGADAKAVGQPSAKPKLLFLVLGETARAEQYSALGYSRPTNQFTDREHVISFADVTSCGTATFYSLPCMFSNLDRLNYSDGRGENREDVLDVLKKAQTNVVWLDNDSGCKGVCDRVKSVQISPVDSRFCDGRTCRDEVFLDYAESLAAETAQEGRDTVVVFHFIGSHGPRYYERFPEEFALFKPYCNRPDVENCSLEEIRNAYDNSIAYTDYVIYQLIDILEQHFDELDPMLLYISDHGESLGEDGVFLHAAPYETAPREQTHIPLQIWLPDPAARRLKVDKQCLADLAQSKSFSHDNFFHSLLGMMEVRSAEYRPELDLFSACRAD